MHIYNWEKNRLLMFGIQIIFPEFTQKPLCYRQHKINNSHPMHPSLQRHPPLSQISTKEGKNTRTTGKFQFSNLPNFWSSCSIRRISNNAHGEAECVMLGNGVS